MDRPDNQNFSGSLSQPPAILPDRVTAVDLGCGPSKKTGAWGVDIHPYNSVDQVMDLDRMPWALPESRFDRVYASHIIEHVASVPGFMNEIYRISRDNAQIRIVTPHFSSVNAYTDPTHRRHLAAGWHTFFTEPADISRPPLFQAVQTEVSFGGNFFNFIPRWFIKLRGTAAWEKKYAFLFTARNITTTLKVIKPDFSGKSSNE